VTARWHEVKRVFGEVLDAPTAERSALLDRLCDGDAELRAEVAALLDEHERAGPSFLDSDTRTDSRDSAALPRGSSDAISSDASEESDGGRTNAPGLSGASSGAGTARSGPSGGAAGDAWIGRVVDRYRIVELIGQHHPPAVGRAQPLGLSPHRHRPDRLLAQQLAFDPPGEPHRRLPPASYSVRPWPANPTPTRPKRPGPERAKA